MRCPTFSLLHLSRSWQTSCGHNPCQRAITVAQATKPRCHYEAKDCLERSYHENALFYCAISLAAAAQTSLRDNFCQLDCHRVTTAYSCHGGASKPRRSQVTAAAVWAIGVRCPQVIGFNWLSAEEVHALTYVSSS